MTGHNRNISDKVFGQRHLFRVFINIKGFTSRHYPEYGLTPGVEVTTGPLGQGFANGVGMAVAEAHLAAVYNRPDFNVIDHYVYAIVTDGDLMEGVAAEAASFAGHQQLGKLIYLYDDNRISIDGSTDLAFTEDRGKRFEAYNWQVLHVDDGNDIEAIDQAIRQAKQDPRPSLIIVRTTIGYGLPTKAGKASAHGEPAGPDELRGAKEAPQQPTEPDFYVPEDVLAHFRQARERGAGRSRMAGPDAALQRLTAGARAENAVWKAGCQKNAFDDLPVYPRMPGRCHTGELARPMYARWQPVCLS